MNESHPHLTSIITISTAVAVSSTGPHIIDYIRSLEERILNEQFEL